MKDNNAIPGKYITDYMSSFRIAYVLRYTTDGGIIPLLIR
jgi:hypothetical protein